MTTRRETELRALIEQIDAIVRDRIPDLASRYAELGLVGGAGCCLCCDDDDDDDNGADEAGK